MSTKRNDLQGLRGVAILLVLLLHLKPKTYPFGFIGVDMFFVLSGYLMTLILSKKTMSLEVICDFYKRRFIRIVPLFAAILTIVYLTCWYYLIWFDRSQLLTDLKWALSFTSNIQPLFEVKGYWDQISSYRLLVHCWSLGVEIQFYLIAPFLLGYCRQYKWNIIVYVALLLSFLFQLLSPPKIAYGIVLSRIWQFLCGTLAFEIEQRKRVDASANDVEEKEMLLPETEPAMTVIRTSKTSQIGFFVLREAGIVLLILVVWYNPEFLNETVVRVIGTLVTASIICIPHSRKSLISESKPLVYIGDISYTLYLVHWPIIVLYKYYYSLSELQLNGVLSCLLIMGLAAIVIHHTLEKFLITSAFKYALLVFIACFSLIIFTSPFYENDIQWYGSQSDGNNVTSVIEEAIKYNNYESKKVYYPMPCEKDTVTEAWTGYKGEYQLRCQTSGNGSLNVLLIGNSIAYRAFPLIHNILNERYNSLRLYSQSSQPTIIANEEWEKAVRIVVEKTKPDIVFLIYGYDGAPMCTPVADWKNDSSLEHIQKNFDFYSEHAGNIVIDLPYYISTIRYAPEIVKRLQLKKPLTDLKITKEELYNQQHWQHERLRHVNCPKCIINDVNEALFYGGTFIPYDRKTYFAYMSDTMHLTPAGLDLLRPKYSAIIEDLISTLSPK